MPIYKVTQKALAPIPATTFETEGLKERSHLQQLIRDQISVLDESLMVIAEEFGDWLDSSRRIDLLCLDREANLVVVELKRTEDGGHMELQALRYAAMVSAMTFEQLVKTYASFRNKADPDLDAARGAILSHLQWDEVDEAAFPQDTRVILASGDFSKELTTAVMWLNDRNLDITCVRLKPYRMEDGTLLLDVEQLIPLPEAADFQTQLGVKKQAKQENIAESAQLRLKFWAGLLAYAKERTPIHANRNPVKDSWIAGSIGRAGFSLNYVIKQTDARVELWITHGTGQGAKNKAAFKALEAQRDDIEQVFGDKLDWQELPDSESCRICCAVEGGYRTPQDKWPAIHADLADAMIRLDKAMRTRVAALGT